MRFFGLFMIRKQFSVLGTENVPGMKGSFFWRARFSLFSSSFSVFFAFLCRFLPILSHSALLCPFSAIFCPFLPIAVPLCSSLSFLCHFLSFSVLLCPFYVIFCPFLSLLCSPSPFLVFPIISRVPLHFPWLLCIIPNRLHNHRRVPDIKCFAIEMDKSQ